MKGTGCIQRSGILLLAFLAACGGGAGETGTPAPASGRAQGAPITGDTLARKVPFSREGFAQSRASEAALAGALASLMVAPVHYAPLPTSIPIRSGVALPSPSVQAQAPFTTTSLAPALLNNFPGLTSTGWYPPDTMGAVGPSYLLSTLNGGVGIFNKATGEKLSEVTLQGFWASLGAGPGQPAYDVYDPKALYDQHSGRFVVAAIGGRAAPASWILVAVSATSDPTGVWYKWAIDADLNGDEQTDLHADFTGLGLDNGYVYIRANMIGTQVGPKIWVIPKPQLLAGEDPITWTEFHNPPDGWTAQPAHVYGASSAEYFVNGGYYYNEGPPPRRFVKVFSITFPSGTPTWTDLGFIQVDYFPLGNNPEAPQPGGSERIDSGPVWILNVVQRNGSLWVTHTVQDNTNSRTEVAWYQLDPAAASLTTPGVPVQQGRIRHATRFYYYPSIAVNANGDVGIGFSGSSPEEYASAYYTARNASDPPGTMQPVATLKPGLDYYSHSFDGRIRWGDYSATCVDPADDLTFWTLQEFADSGNRWATWWGSFPAPASALPAAPANLSATAASLSQISLRWTDQSDNETGFQIERKTGADGTYVQIGTAAADATTYNDTGLAEGTTYYYRVRAVNEAGNSAYSNEASATTTISPPATPANLSATAVSSSRINLNWMDQSANETGFQIERKTGEVGTYAQIGTASANVTTYLDTGLADGTTYFYRVRAVNSAGNSAYSNEANATTAVSPPAAPANLSATAGSSSQIDVAWSDQSANETGFQIERRTGAGGTYAQIGTVAPNATTYNDTGLAEGTTYFYRVRAVNSAGNSEYSNEANAATPVSIPLAPANLSATAASSSQIDLAWTDPSANETGFQIERKTGAGGTYAQIGTAAANVTTYYDTGLAEGTTYFYRVRAVNAAGNSAYSNETGATTASSGGGDGGGCSISPEGRARAESPLGTMLVLLFPGIRLIGRRVKRKATNRV